MNIIDSCREGGGFVIGGRSHSGSAMVFAERIVMLPADFEGSADVGVVLTHLRGDEVVLIGLNSGYERFCSNLLTSLAALKLKHEVMSLLAVCGTYNVLISEGREVCAILLLT